MFTINRKRSVAALPVTAVLLAAATPAGAQISPSAIAVEGFKPADEPR